MSLIVLLTILMEYVRGNVIISTFQNVEECKEINSANANIKCRSCQNIFDCLQEIDTGKATFGLINPEESIISAPFLQNTVVAAEVRDALRNNEPYQEEIVVLTNNGSNFRNARFCDLHENPWVKYSSWIFLDFIFSINEELQSRPSGGMSILQHRYNLLNSFLGESCIPDAKLQNLCKSCTNSQNCTYGADGCTESINCFRKRGNIAITMKNRCNNIRSPYYICRDNTISSEPCSWFSITWPIIITNRENLKKTKKFLDDMFIKHTQANFDLRPYVRLLLYPSRTDEIIFLDKELELVKYIGVTHEIIPKNYTLRWHVNSDLEVQKCLWINRAALYGGLQMNISCERQNRREDCISNVRQNLTDLTIMSKRFSTLSENEIQGVETIAYINNIYPLISLILVKSKEVNTLDGKIGCCSGYKDEGYLSFMAHQKNVDFDFHIHLRNALLNESKICDLYECDKKNKRINKTTLDCLDDQDFAVVTIKDVDDHKILLERNNTFILCKNRVEIYVKEIPVGCYLSKINDQFIVRENFEYKNDVLELFDFIGTMEKFKVFEPFAETPNVLFENGSIGIKNQKPDKMNDPLLIMQSATDHMRSTRTNSCEHKITNLYVMFYVHVFVSIVFGAKMA